MDARLEILVKPKEVKEFFSKNVFIPDTLFFSEEKLDPAGETTIEIPDSLFPAANFSCVIIIRLLTSDNEAITETEETEYYHHKKEIDITLLRDSILFTYKENGKAEAKEVKIFASDNFGNDTELHTSLTPCRLLLNPYFREYTVKSDSAVQSLDIASQPSQLSCLSERTKDSIYIFVENERKIPFTYTIYRRNIEQERGYGDSLTVNKKKPGIQNYFVSVRYLWGGKIKEENYRIPFIDKKLNVSVTQSKIVYPGHRQRR
ncbi:MAG: hypothetical protein MUO72_03375 [Bacteroidales bacterium]|nr:hypothetical protein [Bacteroidales bacterium]